MPSTGAVAHRRACHVVAASLLAVLLAVLAPRASQPQRLRLAGPELVADGIELYRSTDNSMLDKAVPGPMSLVLARLDPRKVTLATALANDCAPSRETVPAIAQREHAIVAVNAGFFTMRGAGAPVGLLKHRGRWISGTSRARGAVAFLAHGQREPTRLAFGRVTVAVSIAVSTLWRAFSIPLAHLSPEPAARGLSFYAAPCGDVASHFSESAAETESARPTTPGVTRAWSLEAIGSKWKVRSMAALPAGASGAAWLVYRGPAVPPALERIRVGTTLTVAPRIGAPDPRVWRDAPDAVGGAGLLVAGGAAVTDWAPEKTVDTFRADRHPRTVIGVDSEGSIWLVAVDGRNPPVSVGMSFAELQRTCLALGLRDALNLDGGGSTTLVVNGQVVNRPSDVTGPRPVSDAIVVRLRRAGS